ncbi:transposase family protein [Shimia sp.]|uniref:transposase family protein n=1 Tax=Shimia sp. TaxID=1954381 RepID=UPI0025FC3ED7|nr:transposase family protein [Shimia sp.]
MQIFLAAFENVPDPRPSNTRYDLGELLVIAFVSVLCGSNSCAEMAAFGRAKEPFFRRGFLKLKHAISSHDTFSDVFQMIDPKALDAAFGKVLDVVRRDPSKTSLSIKLKRAGWDDNFLCHVLNNISAT